MVMLITVAGVLLALFALYASAKRATTVAELEVERGAVRVMRGGIAPPILRDLRDVARRPPMDGVRIRIVRESGRAGVELSGSVTPEQAQRIRNVVGRVPLARLMNAPRRR